MMTVVGHTLLKESCNNNEETSSINNLREALQHIPHPTADVMVRNIANRLSQNMPPQVSHLLLIYYTIFQS